MRIEVRNTSTRDSGAGNGYFTVRAEIAADEEITSAADARVYWNDQLVGRVLSVKDGVLTVRCLPLSYTSDLRQLLDGKYVSEGEIEVDEDGALTRVSFIA